MCFATITNILLSVLVAEHSFRIADQEETITDLNRKLMEHSSTILDLRKLLHHQKADIINQTRIQSDRENVSISKSKFDGKLILPDQSYVLKYPQSSIKSKDDRNDKTINKQIEAKSSRKIL